MASELDVGEKFALDGAEEQRHWQEIYREIIGGATKGSDLFFGHSIPRNDVLYKVRGRAKYAANVTMPGMLHGVFLRSPHAYAKIKRVDVSKAKTAPGVQCVLTAWDVREEGLMVGSLFEDTPVLAKTVVRHVGEPIVAVAAETLEQAEAALDLIEVDYEPMKPILSPEEAIAPGAPQLHEQGNIIADFTKTRGDAEAALKASDIVVEGVYTNDPIEHAYLESPAGISFWDKDVLTLLVCTQYPHFHHKQLARVTGLPMDKIRVVQSVIGGAFGGKIDNTIECAASLMTMKTGRPVKMVLERNEVFSSTTKRHAMKIRHRLGATKDGRLTALDMDVLCDGGAYHSYSLIVAGRCIIHSAMPYDIPAIKTHMMTTFTNHVPSGAMRSFGVIKLGFATESQLNKIADQLGMSPIEIRRINAVKSGTVTMTGQVLQDVGFIKTLDAIEPIYEARKKELAAKPQNGPIKTGLGIASLGYGIGYSGVRNPSTARIEVDETGLVIANCGTPDVGTGSDMALAQIAADAAGIDIARIRVVSGDSTKTDDSGPTSASRTTYFSGSAARIAGNDFNRQFVEALATKLGVSKDVVRLHDDQVTVNNSPMSFQEACKTIGSATKGIVAYGKFDPVNQLDLKNFEGDPYPTYTYATHLAEVEVDTETGRMEVPNYWAAHDAGTLVNPMGAVGQIEGGVVMGLGMAFWERIVRKDGYILNPGYRDYMLPGAKDTPTKIETIFVDNPDPTGPFGAKGVAEASIIPVPAAIAAGLHEATGVRPAKMPMDAETVLDLLDRKEAAE